MKCLCIENTAPRFITPIINNKNDSVSYKIKNFLSYLPSSFMPSILNIKNRVRIQKVKRENESIFLNRNIVICDVCELSWLEPMPTNQELEQYYTSGFWNDKSVLRESINTNPADGERAATQINFIKQFINIKNITSFMEFGAGHAELSYKFHQENPSAKISIVEPDLYFREKHLEIGIINKAFKDIHSVNCEFDLIVASHSLEHVNNIEQTILKFKKILKPNSILMFEVPHACELYFNYYQTDLPHTYFFNKAAIEKICKKFDLELLHLESYGVNAGRGKSSQVSVEIQNDQINPNGHIIKTIIRF